LEQKGWKSGIMGSISGLALVVDFGENFDEYFGSTKARNCLIDVSGQ